MMAMMAVCGAVAAAVAVGYLRMVSDSRVHAVADISQISPGPFVGYLPTLARGLVPREMGGSLDQSLPADRFRDGSKGSNDGPNSMAALLEGVRMVRTALLERLTQASPQAAILVTSSTSRAGKTSLALLLAQSLAAAGKKVLLVECDFYRPTLSPRIGLEPGVGLADLLARRAEDAQAIRRTGTPRLDVLPAGNVHDCSNPEALANGVFRECMARWKLVYDFVVLDSPPVLPVADARILAGHVDGSLLLVRAGQDRRPEVCGAFSRLAATRGGVLGLVVIGGDTPGAPYYSGCYGYGSYAPRQDQPICDDRGEPGHPADAPA
jgi:capsular exopolysaccharide synthesis family protein